MPTSMPAETMKRSGGMRDRSPSFGPSQDNNVFSTLPEQSTFLKQNPVGNFTTPSNFDLNEVLRIF